MFIDCYTCVLYVFIQGPAGPTSTPGTRGEDGNPGPRVGAHKHSCIMCDKIQIRIRTFISEGKNNSDHFI